MKKTSVQRPFPPDYVSAETLAYRLDCSRSTIDDYVKQGLLPKPDTVGNLVRWDFDKVRQQIAALNNTADAAEADPYVTGIARARPPQH